MIITCPSCKRKYRLEERAAKLPYQKVRCSRCGHIFVYERPARRDDQLPPDRPPAEKGAVRRVRVLPFIVLAIIIILAVGAYFYWVNYLGPSDRWLSMKKVEGQETVIRDGKVFLIRGLILNGSTKRRKYAILKARLFDKGGAVIGEHFALAGLPLSYDEAKEMSEEEVEKRVADFRLSALSTFVLHRNKELPFSIVFPGTYKAKPKEFTVEIIESPRE